MLRNGVRVTVGLVVRRGGKGSSDKLEASAGKKKGGVVEAERRLRMIGLRKWRALSSLSRTDAVCLGESRGREWEEAEGEMMVCVVRDLARKQTR